MSVGDLIEGYTNREQVVREWEEIEAYVNTLDMPFFYVVGNHDVGDETSREVWRERRGRSYYHFVYKDTLFLCMDSEDPPQGSPDWIVQEVLEVRSLAERDPRQAAVRGQVLQQRVKESFVNGEAFTSSFSDEQISYFRDVLTEHADVKWTFVFVHRPVWQAIEENQRFKEIEAALAGRAYTIFAGHSHTYDLDQRNGMDYLRLSTTGGTWVMEPPGNFDHIVWVTMTDEGPIIGNITLDGIFGKSGERKPVRGVLQ
jgi:predicted phosphodiesterase